MKQLASFCYRRRRLVVVLWMIGAALVMTIGYRYAAAADNNFTGGSSDSGQAQRILDRHFPGQRGDPLTLAVRADAADRNAPGLDALLARVAAAPGLHVSGPLQASPDGRSGFVGIDSDQSQIPTSTARELIDAAHTASGNGVSFAFDGESVLAAEVPYGGPTEGFGVLAAMVVLLVSFGSLLAMGLPLITGLLGIGTGLALDRKSTRLNSSHVEISYAV